MCLEKTSRALPEKASPGQPIYSKRKGDMSKQHGEEQQIVTSKLKINVS